MCTYVTLVVADKAQSWINTGVLSKSSWYPTRSQNVRKLCKPGCGVWKCSSKIVRRHDKPPIGHTTSAQGRRHGATPQPTMPYQAVLAVSSVRFNWSSRSPQRCNTHVRSIHAEMPDGMSPVSRSLDMMSPLQWRDNQHTHPPTHTRATYAVCQPHVET